MAASYVLLVVIGFLKFFYKFKMKTITRQLGRARPHFFHQTPLCMQIQQSLQPKPYRVQLFVYPVECPLVSAHTHSVLLHHSTEQTMLSPRLTSAMLRDHYVKELMITQVGKRSQIVQSGDKAGVVPGATSNTVRQYIPANTIVENAQYSCIKYAKLVQ